MNKSDTERREGWKNDFDEVTSDKRNNSLQRFIQQRAVIETECDLRDAEAARLTTPCKADLVKYWHDSIEQERIKAQIEVLEEVFSPEDWCILFVWLCFIFVLMDICDNEKDYRTKTTNEMKITLELIPECSAFDPYTEMELPDSDKTLL